MHLETLAQPLGPTSAHPRTLEIDGGGSPYVLDDVPLSATDFERFKFYWKGLPKAEAEDPENVDDAHTQGALVDIDEQGTLTVLPSNGTAFNIGQPPERTHAIRLYNLVTDEDLYWGYILRTYDVTVKVWPIPTPTQLNRLDGLTVLNTGFSIHALPILSLYSISVIGKR
jgi:hypothetical protein